MNAFSYENKRVLVVGAASGMGAAAAKNASGLGGEIVALDVAPIEYDVSQAIQADLRDKADIDRALDEISGPVDVVYACAGVADGTPGLMQINFIAQRHLIDRLIERDALRRGGAIVMISSVAGLGWMQQLPTLLDFLANESWEEAEAWLEKSEVPGDYRFSKAAINAYVASQAYPMLKRGLRINTVLPGPTDTPLARANAETWLAFGADYREDCGVDALSPEQIANVMAFLGSDAASGVNGLVMLVDYGHVSACVTDAWEFPRVKMMMGLE